MPGRAGRDSRTFECVFLSQSYFKRGNTMADFAVHRFRPSILGRKMRQPLFIRDDRNRKPFRRRLDVGSELFKNDPVNLLAETCRLPIQLALPASVINEKSRSIYGLANPGVSVFVVSASWPTGVRTDQRSALMSKQPTLASKAPPGGLFIGFGWAPTPFHGTFVRFWHLNRTFVDRRSS